jgi:type II secretory pathway pseudopilin PulG
MTTRNSKPKTVRRLDGKTVRHKTQDARRKTQDCPRCCPPFCLRQKTGGRGGSLLVLVLIAMVILTVMGTGLLTVAYGVRLDAIRLKNETVARLAAEAGYEKALYWMSQQQDMLSTLQKGIPGTTGNLSFPDCDCNYQIQLFSFAGSRPIYRIVSTGHSGVFSRTTDALVIQAVSGWDMGQCRVPSGKSSTVEVYFVNGEVIDIPVNINNLKDKPDNRDIYIIGSPRFLEEVGMGESRYAGKTDKYKDVISLFEDGIDFDQPDCKIADETVIQSKVDRFKDSTAVSYKFTPTASSGVSPSYPAVQLEFFVEGGVGKVRITNNCTVQADNPGDYDYSVVPDSGGTKFQQYKIYAYHFKPTSQPSIVVPITDTYVTQSFRGVQSEPGGQIYIKGNVVIGSSDYTDMVVKGKITVVAGRGDDGTGGNIWVADSIVVDGSHDANGMPAADNPNILGLIAQNVVKVVNPTRSTPSEPSGLTYQPIGITKSGSQGRFLPDPTVVEAAITVGGGGWGAEDVGDRREYSGDQDDLIVRGSITEALRGVVGLSGSKPDGYLKHYYLDKRLLEGILPGDIWLRGKYIPAPAGWHDYRPAN